MHCYELCWTWFLDHWMVVKTVQYCMILMCTLHLQYLYDISSRRLGPALRLILRCYWNYRVVNMAPSTNLLFSSVKNKSEKNYM